MRSSTLPTHLLWTVITAAIGVACAGVNSHLVEPRPLVAAMVGVIAAGAGQLALVRPKTALLLNGAAVGTYFALGFADGPIFLTLAMTAHVAALSLRPKAHLPTLAFGLAFFQAGLLTRAVQHERASAEVWWQAVANVALAIAAAAAGWWWRDRDDARRERAGRVATEEQLRMARDLHDGVGHGLAVIAMQSGVGLHVLDSDPEAARRALLAIREASSESLTALRSELSTLTRGSDVDTAPRRPGRGIADLPAVLDRVRATGVHVDWSQHGRLGDVPADVQAAAYAIVQEALTNVLKHSGASRVDAGLRRDVDLTVWIRDDGRGGTSGVGDDTGLGIAGMRSRAEALGGVLVAGEVSDGFDVEARLPVPVEAEGAS